MQNMLTVSSFVRFGVKKEDYDLYRADYIKLYIENIRKIVMTEDTSRPFVSSSPSNGVETAAEGWLARNPRSYRFGDGTCFSVLVQTVSQNADY